MRQAKEERFRWKVVLAWLLFLTILPIVGAQPADPPQTLKLSMAKTFVRDQPEILVAIFIDELKEVMKAATGLNGDVHVTDSAAEIAARIDAKQLDFGIVHAHEFACLRAKYPALSPFLTVKEKDKHADLVVHKESPAKSIADLRGKSLDLPQGSKEYCRVYLDKLCADQRKSKPGDFFGTLAKSPSQFSALDQVACKKADATIVESIWLDFYKELKGPVFAKNLRILTASGVVPPAVIIYRNGKLDQPTLDRVRVGMLKAHNIPRGRALMMLWQIDAFEAVPANYAKRLDEVAKEFPAPRPPR